jgi:hypothetical protein
VNIYRVLGDGVGTNEARELAEQLVAWHDAMVRHLRIVGPRRSSKCADDCPHEEASSFWAAAQDAFGVRAKNLTFLRAHGQGRRVSTMSVVRDRAAELSI